MASRKNNELTIIMFVPAVLVRGSAELPPVRHRSLQEC